MINQEQMTKLCETLLWEAPIVALKHAVKINTVDEPTKAIIAAFLAEREAAELQCVRRFVAAMMQHLTGELPEGLKAAGWDAAGGKEAA